jgi:hypothetical protein
MRTPGLHVLAMLASVLAVSPARGLIFFSSGDPAFNTRPPTGALADCGWKWVGDWGGFQGTVIGPHQFLTARHIGGLPGGIFFLNGAKFATTAFYDDAASDLRIWIVQGRFRSWAPLYRTHDELGKSVVVMGRGRGRGVPVVVNGSVNGWSWGGGAGPLRWGRNSVASIVDGSPNWGVLLFSSFSPSKDPNEADLAGGDSGGPVFIKAGGSWELAGVAAGVTGPFNDTNAGSGFGAAIFDVRGLYSRDAAGRWQRVEGAEAVATGFYASRVSIRIAWIDSVLRMPYIPTNPVLLPRPGRPQ